MPAASPPRSGIDRRLAALGGALRRKSAGRRNRLLRLLGEELSTNPRRVRIAIRVGLECAVGMGLMAAMQVDSILGAYVLYNLVASGAPMLRPAMCALLILLEAAALTLSHPLAGILVEAPWLMLSFFALETAAYGYLVSRLQLGAVWLMVQVTFLGTFYVVVFAPNDFGWGLAYTFGGVTVAFLVITLFDTVLWPEPAEAALLESLRASLERTRARLKNVVHGFLEPGSAHLITPAPLISHLPAHLNLLSRAASERSETRRDGVLLAFVTTIERLYVELARLTFVAGERAPRVFRDLFKPQLEAVAEALDRSLARLDEYIAGGIVHGSASPMAESALEVAACFKALDARRDELAILRRPEASAAEINVMGGFMTGLRAIARLLELSPDDTPTPVRKAPAQSTASKLFPLDPDATKYATKLGVAIALAYVVGLTTQRGDLTVILWTVVIAGLPTYGATYRKMWLRLIGGVIGGAIGLAMIIFVTPNFETVLSYMIACFLALAAAGYAAQSSDRINYAARQAGTSFVLVFAGLSPSEDIYAPLWRVWGMLLGIAIVALVFLILWPDYATDSLVPRIKKLLRTTIDLMPGGAAASSDEQIQSAERDVMKTANEVLTVADDARLEGRASAIDPDRVVDAAGTLRRIAYRAGSVSDVRLQTPMPPLAPETRSARAAFEAELRARHQSWLDYIEQHRPPSSRTALAWAAQHDPSRLGDLLKRYTDRISASGYAEVAKWPADARVALLGEIESYQRFVVLAGELDDNLSRVPLPRNY
jgi:Fusaric acid resistance protein family